MVGAAGWMVQMVAVELAVLEMMLGS